MSAHQTERVGAAAKLRRRNLIVLLALIAFVAFAFVLSFRHVTREMGGGAVQRSGTTN
ncbi:hypothetical protein BOSEA31B_15094 [Hyphomicrobiales bacterium]|nr:hypothetical protein BOSEA31B_15094 [Hyphomicrobiales bacterium]CAH1701583.1 hypothetical protein BOSEA1005_21282 [Hyphomicrobiales bacterium]CAI0345751.1 hypothetical protein BO1005MUT1_430001 [Hyphomicrobiales bacterium]